MEELGSRARAEDTFFKTVCEVVVSREILAVTQNEIVKNSIRVLPQYLVSF